MGLQDEVTNGFSHHYPNVLQTQDRDTNRKINCGIHSERAFYFAQSTKAKERQEGSGIFAGTAGPTPGGATRTGPREGTGVLTLSYSHAVPMGLS
jgi:hypothetical protein